MNCLYYSDAGTTEKISKYIANAITGEVVSKNIINDHIKEEISFSKDDILILGMPVYGGRVIKSCVKELKLLKGNGATAIAIAVYGNRDYDDALIEMVDILREQGFYVLAGGVFLAQHSMLPKVATGRPDEKDFEKIDEFIALCKEKLQGEKTEITVPGNRPYEGNPFEFVLANTAAKGMTPEKIETLTELWSFRKEPEWYL